MKKGSPHETIGVHYLRQISDDAIPEITEDNNILISEKLQVE